MITADATYNASIVSGRTPVYAVEFRDPRTNSLLYTFATAPIPTAGVTVFDYMQLPMTNTPAQLYPDRAQSSVGSIQFVLTDVAGVVTAAIKSSGIAPGISYGTTAVFKMGSASISYSHYVTAFSGIVTQAVSGQSNSGSTDLSSFLFTISEASMLTNRQIFNPTTTTLLSSITSGSTQIAVANNVDQLPVGYAVIDGEIVQWTGKAGSGASIGNNTWKSIASDGTNFVAVAADGSVSFSPDGKNWIAQIAPELNNWNGVCWSPSLGLFVAVASTGIHRAMTSPDGQVWTAQTAPANTWNAVCWSPTLNLLAATGSPGLMTSPDGITWTTRGDASFSSLVIAWDNTNHIFSTVQATSADGVTWINRSQMDGINAMAYRPSGTLWVAVGNNSLVQTSTDDGTTWVIQSYNGQFGGITPAGIVWRGVADSGSLFVVVGNAGFVATSSNGTSWTMQTAAAAWNWASVVWASGLSLWIAVSENGTAGQGRIMTSPDGVTWTLRAELVGGKSIAWNGTVALTPNASSTDGINWKNRSALEGYNTGIAYSSSLGRWVACGTAASGVMYSSNGQDWTIGSNPFAVPPSTVAWSPSLAIFVLCGSTDVNNNIATSSDGISWTIRTVPQGNWSGVAWDAGLGMFAAVGSGTNKIVTSTNGTTWTARSAPGGTSGWCAIASNGASLFCAVRNDAAGTTNQAMTSTDGVTWTGQTTAENNPWQAICWFPTSSNFVVVASSGTHQVMNGTGSIWALKTAAEANQWMGVAYDSTAAIIVASAANGTHRFMSSTDMITWTARSAVGTPVLGVVGASGAGLFVACELSGGVQPQRSTNGTSWSADTPIESNTWQSIVWSGGLSLFVAVSSDGTDRVATTADGKSWTPQTAAEANPWLSITWAAGSINLLVAIASGGTHQLMTSPDGVTWTARSQAQTETWSCVLYGDNFVASASVSIKSRSMKSTNGTTWTSVSPCADKNTWTALTWASGFGKWLAFSLDGGARGATSTDSITWTETFISSGETFSGVVYTTSLGTGSGFAVVISSLTSFGNFYYTSDGTTWNSVPTPVEANTWRAIAFSTTLTRFVAVSDIGDGSNSAAWSNNGTAWTISQLLLTGLNRGLLFTTAAAHTAGVAVKEFIRLQGHPIDIFSGIMYTYTDKTGLQVSSSLIDTATLAALKTAIGAGMVVDFRIPKAWNAKTFFEQQIFQPLALFPIQHNGLYSLGRLAALATSVYSYSHDNIVEDPSSGQPVLGYDSNWAASIINQVSTSFDYDVVTDSYKTTKVYNSPTSQLVNGVLPIPPIQSIGWRTEIGNTPYLTTAMNNLFAVFGNGAAIVTFESFMASNLVELGDTTDLTTSLILNTSTSPPSRGLVSKKMLITGLSRMFDQGYVATTALLPF